LLGEEARRVGVERMENGGLRISVAVLCCLLRLCSLVGLCDYHFFFSAFALYPAHYSGEAV